MRLSISTANSAEVMPDGAGSGAIKVSGSRSCGPVGCGDAVGAGPVVGTAVVGTGCITGVAVGGTDVAVAGITPLVGLG